MRCAIFDKWPVVFCLWNDTVIYHPQTELQEGNVFTGICLSGGAVDRWQEMIHGIDHIVEYPLPKETSGGVPSSPSPGKVINFDIRPGNSPSDIWCWSLKHIQYASGQYESYWNAFLYILRKY